MFWYLTIWIFLTFHSAMSEDSSGGVDVTWPEYNSPRLPGSLRPKLYNITIKPDMYGGMVDSMFPFECNTTIYLECIEDTDIIRLHSLHEITSISISFKNDAGVTESVSASQYRSNSVLETIEIQAGITLKAGKEYALSIQSNSNITSLLMGFYYSPYVEDGHTRYIITTMMEPTCARQVFPCFDEPDFKAVFLLNIYRKDDAICISNLPRRHSKGPDAEGFYVDVFDEPKDVPMSTYLVAFACGDIDYLQDYMENIRIRTYSRRNVVHLTGFALEMAKKTLKFFQDYFNVKYPLPKEDMIAVPTMSFSAMEHWGMITYRENAMLFEQGVSSETDKEWIAIIVSHEISHQWFGNIVSPKWWDDLWLNEGFATYMMFLATDRILPDWEIMNKQVLDFRGLQNVMSVDDKLSSHPVYMPVDNSNEIFEIFDLISYAKGSAVIRMMNFFLGEETFKKGLTRYLHDFSFNTATHNDLWSSLEKQAIEDNNMVTNIKMIMDTWILEMNYPVVMVTKLANNVTHIQQMAFLQDEAERQQRKGVFWEIPFTYTTSLEGNFDKTAADIIWLHKDGFGVNITDDQLAESDWILANIRQYGFFRVNYDEANWRALFGQLNTDPFVIHPINRAQIINDAWNLQKAELLSFEIALQTLDYLDKETDYVAWKAALRELESVRSALQVTPLYGLFEDFMQSKLQNAFLATQGAKTHYEIIKYSLLAKEACRYGISACVDEAVQLFSRWVQDEKFRINPDMVETVYCMGVEHGGRAAWDHVMRTYTHSQSAAEKAVLLQALACATEPWILAKSLNMTVQSDVFSQTDRIILIQKIAENPVGRLMVWGFLEDNWQTYFDQYGSVLNLFPELVKAITGPFNTGAELRRVELFLAQKEDLGTATRQFSNSVSKIKSQKQWLDKHYGHFEAWLRSRVKPRS